MDPQVREFFPVSLSKLTAFLQVFEDVTAIRVSKNYYFLDHKEMKIKIKLKTNF
jgi:hypothetical protein